MLFEQIAQLMTVNGGEYYTSNDLQAAERAIKEEKARLIELKIKERGKRQSRKKFLKAG